MSSHLEALDTGRKTIMRSYQDHHQVVSVTSDLRCEVPSDKQMQIGIFSRWRPHVNRVQFRHDHEIRWGGCGK